MPLYVGGEYRLLGGHLLRAALAKDALASIVCLSDALCGDIYVKIKKTFFRFVYRLLLLVLLFLGKLFVVLGRSSNKIIYKRFIIKTS